MRDWIGKTYWIVGASEGLGRDLAMMVSKAGAEVILSARNEDRLRHLAEALPGKARVEPLDIRDTRMVRDVADRIGPIDGVIFLAGVYWPVPASSWNEDQVETMCDVNFTGAARVLGAVVPGMVEADSGHIVMVGSLSGFRGLPGSIGYSSSKAGMMHMAESLHADLRKTGVTVQLANPGFIRTRLTDKNEFKMPYIMEPEAAAQEVFEHMNSDRFKKSFPWLFSLFFRAGNFLPDWAYYRIFGA